MPQWGGELFLLDSAWDRKATLIATLTETAVLSEAFTPALFTCNYQKLSQQCSSAILQYKIKRFEKKKKNE